MDTNNNLYTIIYATVMVIVVAVVLALASSLLKERQDRNVELERKQMVLRSVHLGTEIPENQDKNDFIEQEYAKYITDSSIIENGRELVLYVCKLEDNQKKYIIPLHGAGLWGPVWGYISLQDDFNTVSGAVFDHKSETPGLGAEITTPMFYNQFIDKQIFDNTGKYVSIRVVKGGAAPDSKHQVDAISGGTITSEAVEEMLRKNISEYLNFFKTNLQSAAETAKAEAEAKADATVNNQENN
ncbi:MAG: NADH:ubiquinone reductase (Na(+)-transporting) subunit C [Bacteroidales bacterium]